MLQAAEEAWNRKDFQQGIDVLERASQMDPANSGILLQLGRAYGLRYDYAAAGRCFEKAIRIAPKKIDAMANAGKLSIDFANHQMAEHYFRRTLEQKDASPETFIRLAELYERLHRVEDASRFVDQALRLDGTCAPALLARARLHRQVGLLEEAECLLAKLLTNAEREIRIRGYYELATVLDRQGHYDEAMSAFFEAKSLLLSDAPPLLAQLKIIRAYTKEMYANISAEMLQRWSDSDPVPQPSHRLAFLGGHARSGTTLLEQVLDSHEDIVSAEETTIFHDDAYVPLQRNPAGGSTTLSLLDSTQAGALQQSRKNYFHSMELHLGGPIGERLLIDKNPSINVLIPAFLRVFPEIKLLVALRDPRDVCLSCFMQAHFPISAGSVSYLSLEDTVEAYTHVLGLWKTLAPLINNPWLEVRYEDMVDDLELTSRKVLDFLGVSWNPDVLRFYEHAQKKRVRSPTYADVANPVFKRALGRWRNYRKYLEPYLDKLEPFVKAFGYE